MNKHIGMSLRGTVVVSMVGCLLLGFGLGWTVHWAARKPSSITNSPFARSVKAAEETATASAAVPTTVPADAAQSGEDAPITEQRAAVIAWFKAQGMPISIPPMQFPSDHLSSLFIRAFDLSPAEVGQLNASLDQAREQYDTLIGSFAMGAINANGTRLTVRVPPMPEEGGAIHDSLLAAFEQVLGPDHFRLFDAMSRDAFEHSFDQFGIGAVTYTIGLEPVRTAGGKSYYEVVRTTTGPKGTSISGSNSQLDAAGVRKTAPFVERFLPADFGQPGKP